MHIFVVHKIINKMFFKCKVCLVCLDIYIFIVTNNQLNVSRGYKDELEIAKNAE